MYIRMKTYIPMGHRMVNFIAFKVVSQSKVVLY